MIALFLIFGAVTAVQFPDAVKLCHRSDPNFQKCVAKNMGDSLKYFINGYKELGVPPLEPLSIEKLEIDGNSGSTVSVTQKYKNIKVYGITKSNFEKYFQFELDGGCKWETDVYTPMIRMEAEYNIQGQLLLFPLNSSGNCNITQYDTWVRHNMLCEKFTKKGDTYLRVTGYTMDINPDKISFDFDNILPGNEQISKEIGKTINENSIDIFNEAKGGIGKALSAVYVQYLNNVFFKIPLNQIFLD